MMFLAMAPQHILHAAPARLIASRTAFASTMQYLHAAAVPIRRGLAALALNTVKAATQVAGTH